MCVGVWIAAISSHFTLEMLNINQPKYNMLPLSRHFQATLKDRINNPRFSLIIFMKPIEIKHVFRFQTQRRQESEGYSHPIWVNKCNSKTRMMRNLQRISRKYVLRSPHIHMHRSVWDVTVKRTIFVLQNVANLRETSSNVSQIVGRLIAHTIAMRFQSDFLHICEQCVHNYNLLQFWRWYILLVAERIALPRSIPIS